MLKAPGFQKVFGLAQNPLPPHEPGMREMQDDAIAHSLDPRALHCDFPVIRTGEAGGQKRIKRSIARDHAALETHRAQPRRQAGVASAKFAAAAAQQARPKRDGSQMIHDFAPVIRRGEHDHSSQVFEGVVREKLSDHDSPKGVRNKMRPNRMVAYVRSKEWSQRVIGDIRHRPAKAGIIEV
jgi:hypothetical protein